MAVLFDSILGDIAVIVATLLFGLYLYFAKAFRYWKRRGVAYEEPTLLFGNLSTVFLQKEHLAQCMKKVYDRNPRAPFVGLYGGKKPFLMIRDLDLVRNVMVKDAYAFLDRTVDVSEDKDPLLSRSLFFLKGSKWRHMRVKLTPVFTSGKIKNMFYLINECGKQLVSCIDREMSKGSCLVKDTIARYSTDVIASCGFGLNSNSLADKHSEFRNITRKMFEITKLEGLVTSLAVFAPWLVKLLGLNAFDDSVNSYLRRTFWDVADHRKRNKVNRKDFVDIIMQMKNEGEIRAEDAKDLEEIKQDSKYMEAKNMGRHKLDIKLEDDDFVAQAMIFIAAGFETSSSVISFTLFELARNPVVQDQLRKEIHAVLDKHNSEVTYDAIAEMSYLEMVVSETLRKYPTVPVLERKCLSDYKIPGTDITVEKGTSVVIPALGIHMDPAIYPEPEKFDPQRFSPENKSTRPSFAHLPFGEGPRICIGMRFGQMQVKTALVHILTNFKVKPCADTPQPPLGMIPYSPVNIPIKSIVLAFEKFK